MSIDRDIRRVQKALRNNEKRILGHLAEALFGEATQIANMSAKIVPVDTNTLRRSLYVEPPNPAQSTRTMKTSVGYGVDYAVVVHEKVVGVEHKAPTQAKFLSTPFKTRKQGFVSRLRKRILAKVESGGPASMPTGKYPTKPLITGGK